MGAAGDIKGVRLWQTRQFEIATVSGSAMIRSVTADVQSPKLTARRRPSSQLPRGGSPIHVNIRAVTGASKRQYRGGKHGTT